MRIGCATEADGDAGGKSRNHYGWTEHDVDLVFKGHDFLQGERRMERERGDEWNGEGDTERGGD